MCNASTDDEFDFDDWATLYRRDPNAFEARRRALLSRALEHGDENQRARGRGVLARFEQGAIGLDTEDRLTFAVVLMRESLEQLQRGCESLTAELPDGEGGPRNP